MPELWARERGRREVLQLVRDGARLGGAFARAAQGRHRSLLRPRRLDRARRVDRSRGAARAHAPLLRGSPRHPRAPRRHRREVRRRRGHGRLRHPGLARGRCAARRSCRGGDARTIAEHGLEARIGVNTGEVVVGGEGETLVTGDAVNVAARLEQAADSGEIAHRRRDETPRARRRAGRGGRATRAEGEVGARRGVPAPRGPR